MSTLLAHGPLSYGLAHRMVEAMLFASPDPLSEADIAARLPEGSNAAHVLADLEQIYRPRGVNLVKVAGKWTFRTAEDLSFLLQIHAVEQRRLSRAALETLAIIGYHQPCTRAEMEEIRGVTTSRGTLDVLLETGWVRMRGRRRAPGRPVTYGTTEAFLVHFGLDSISDLPGLEELKGAGLLDSVGPITASMPIPTDSAELTADEDPLDGGEDVVDDLFSGDENGLSDGDEVEIARDEP